MTLALFAGKDLVVEKKLFVGPNWERASELSPGARPITFGIRIMTTGDAENAEALRGMKPKEVFLRTVARVAPEIEIHDESGAVVTDEARRVEIAAEKMPLWIFNALASAWIEVSSLSEADAGN